jgi:hypothetical protein
VLLVGALPAFAHEDHCTEVGGVENDAGQCIQAAAVEITSVYPIEAAHISNEMAAAIDAYIAESYNSMVELFAQGFVPSVAIPWVMNIESEVVDGVSTVSAVFTRYTYTGGANGIGEYHTVTAVVDGGNVLALSDIFVEGVDPYTTLQPLAEAALMEQAGDMTDPEMIAAGTEPLPENYDNWALTTDSLNLYFDEYQVAAGAAGPIMIAIPLSELSDVLQPQYLPS